MIIEEEKWGWVIGYEGWNEISTLGNLRTYRRMGMYPKKLEKSHPIKPCKDGRGYFNFGIRVNGKPKIFLVHIEQAKTFIPNPNGYKLVRHLNDIKTDNRLDNLAWGTHADNRQDAVRNGSNFHRLGERAAKAKLTEAQVAEIFSSTDNNCKIGRRYGVTEGTISKIKLGRGWNRVTGMPPIR